MEQNIEKINKVLNKVFKEIKKLSINSKKVLYVEEIFTISSLSEIEKLINIFLQQIKEKAKIENFDTIYDKCDEYMLFFHYNKNSKDDSIMMDEEYVIVKELCYKLMGKNNRKIKIPIDLSDLELLISAYFSEEDFKKILEFMVLRLFIITNLM